MKTYYVDFSSWVVEAENGLDAVEKAREIMKGHCKVGEYPHISSVEETGTVGQDDYEEPCVEVE